MDFSSNDFIVTYGIPEKLLSNRIKEFKNGFSSETPYNSQTNEQVEEID